MAYHPYAIAFPAPAFTLRSPDFTDGAPLPDTAYAAHGGESPALNWDGLPAGTRSLVVTAFDADAPIPGGLWHWAVKDVPAAPGGLGRGARAGVPLVNDLGVAGYSGVRPPAGTGVHRLFVCATALGVPELELPPGASLAMLHILMIPHTLGRAILVGTSTPAS
ncbi:YbhB/YbcL family Raf kinase inhibitor-like protein [Catenuloplanes atrovinosus]|uniref:Raf kinase inhibitor-like YbhB/YbcL family protein n=1 Tax=Catenuloplanes atrovinosus TaxID=137266 RepID=A0AAE4C924_9ACTN|nr:YbhB/YbcL family Raf kinase inhibitor-like protein [Catenuloplanes atrovinosus]MDR7275277.1 Raf kinase inhibitor-like YbhB/YbcL family protein [Catenuloplanes atrovinosus]